MHSFSFIPRSDQEIAALNSRLLAEGLYYFEVREAQLTLSKSKNPMIQLRLAVRDQNGAEHSIVDYLVATDEMAWKLKHFCDSTDMEPLYLTGKLTPEDCISKRGYAKITVQKGKLKPDQEKLKPEESKFYPDRNSVKDYIKTKAEPAQKFNPDQDIPY